MSDAEVFGNYKKDRNAIFLEAINMVLEIWKGDGPYNLQGEYFSVTTAQHDDPGDRSGHDPQAVPEAASADRRHCGRAALQEASPKRPSAAGLRSRRTSCCPNGSRRTGRATSRAAKRSAQPPIRPDWRVAKCIFVADDEATAKRYGKSAEGPYHFYFKQLLRKLVRRGRPRRISSSSTRASPTHAITPER